MRILETSKFGLVKAGKDWPRQSEKVGGIGRGKQCVEKFN